jgi:hypothetical protein
MVENVRSFNRDLFVRRCVCCGYDGALLKAGLADRCARCGCDLMDRPARSYAEMEGLIGQPALIEAPTAIRRASAQFIQRWLVFLFVVLLGLLSLAYLAQAAIP